MNRQARLEGSENWIDFGNVTFFQAIKKLAVATSKKHGVGSWVIECRCSSQPEKVSAFEVQTTIHAEVVNPRQGDL